MGQKESKKETTGGRHADPVGDAAPSGHRAAAPGPSSSPARPPHSTREQQASYAYRSKATGMNVYVAVEGGVSEDSAPLCVEAGPQWTVEDLRDASAVTAGVDPALCSLTFGGTELKLSDELADVGIGAEAHVILQCTMGSGVHVTWTQADEGTTEIEEDGMLAVHDRSCTTWGSVWGDPFQLGTGRLLCLECVKVCENANICAGIFRHGACTNIYPREPGPGLWFFMFCWGGSVFYSPGPAADRTRKDDARIYRSSKNGSRFCAALSPSGVLRFQLDGEVLAPPTKIKSDGQQFHFYVSMYEKGAAVRIVTPRTQECIFAQETFRMTDAELADAQQQ